MRAQRRNVSLSIELLQLETIGRTFNSSVGVEDTSLLECLCVLIWTRPVDCVVWCDVNNILKIEKHYFEQHRTC